MEHFESSAKGKVHSTKCLHKEPGEFSHYPKALELKDTISPGGTDDRKESS